MLPHVKAYHRYALDINNTVHEWVIFVVGLSDEHAAIGADSEPDPARDDPAAGSLSESLLEAREVCEVLSDRVGQRTNWLVLSVINSTTKLAEKEHARTGGDFNAIVQRLWAEARRELEQQREHERREDAWAAGEALEEAPGLEQAPPQGASGEIRRRLSPAAESETPADMPIANPPVTPADASSATTPRKSAKRKKRPPRKSRTADEL